MVVHNSTKFRIFGLIKRKKSSTHIFWYSKRITTFNLFFLHRWKNMWEHYFEWAFFLFSFRWQNIVNFFLMVIPTKPLTHFIQTMEYICLISSKCFEICKKKIRRCFHNEFRLYNNKNELNRNTPTQKPFSPPPVQMKMKKVYYIFVTNDCKKTTLKLPSKIESEKQKKGNY